MANRMNGSRIILPPFFLKWLAIPHVRWLLRGVALVVILMVGGRTVLQAYRMGMDFQWDATYLLLQGVNPYLATAEQQLVESSLYPVLAPYVPSALLLLTPYAVLPYEVARHLWIGSNLLFSVGTVIVLFPTFLGRHGTVDEVIGLIALWVISTPWGTTVSLGQHSLYALFFFVLALYFGKQGRMRWAGLFLALSWLKYAVTLPLSLYFLYKQWHRPPFIAVGLHIGLHGIAMLLLSESPLQLLLQPFQVAPIMLEQGGFLDLTALQRYLIFLVPGVGSATSWLYGLTILGIVWLIILVRRAASDYEMFVLTTLSMVTLILLYSINYDFVILILPLFFLIYRGIPPLSRIEQWVIAAALIGVFYVTRVTNLIVATVPATTARVIAQTTLLALIALYYGAVFLLFIRSRSTFRIAINQIHPSQSIT